MYVDKKYKKPTILIVCLAVNCAFIFLNLIARTCSLPLFSLYICLIFTTILPIISYIIEVRRKAFDSLLAVILGFHIVLSIAFLIIFYNMNLAR